jgi:hypothetical protein
MRGDSIMDQMSSFSRHDFEAKIVKRSWEDEDFRREFTSDPAGAFVKYLNAPPASLPEITVHQEEPGSWHIVLPQKPLNANELSDQDLEKVAGGSTPACVASFVVSTAVTLVSVDVSVSAMSFDSGW